jgi:TonB family protein
MSRSAKFGGIVLVDIVKLIIATTLLLAMSCPLFAGNNTVGQQLLVAAEQQAQLFHDSSSPFRLDLSFTAQQVVPVQGHLTWTQATRDRWRREVTLSDFKQIEIRNGESFYTSRSLSFTPFRVSEVMGLLLFAQSPENLVWKKQKQLTENGVEMACLKVKGENGRGKPQQICIDSRSHDILSVEWKEPPDESRREQFKDYFDFGGHRYPHTLELLVNGSKVITAHVESLNATTFDDALLVPPKDAIERRLCAGMKHAIPVSTPDPLYPKSASQNKLAGDTIVAMTVLIDGSVTDVQLIGRSAQSMDDTTLETLKHWRFKPAMCGTEPVISDIQVVVSFRMQ